MKQVFYYPALAIILISSLSFKLPAQTRLPANWLPGMKLVIYHGPGMREEFHSTFISDSACYTVYNNGSKETTKVFMMAATDLNDVLNFLREKKFDHMETLPRRGIVDDMGTSSIVLRWNSQIIGVSTGASMTVEKNMETDLSDIFSYLGMLVVKKETQANK